MDQKGQEGQEGRVVREYSEFFQAGPPSLHDRITARISRFRVAAADRQEREHYAHIDGMDTAPGRSLIEG